jgi:hypothetical protein
MLEKAQQGTRPDIESQERKQLRELESTGLYVFHGTSADVEALEPRQAVDAVTGHDDDPGIHASQVADYAIFMAVAAPLGHARAGATVSDETPEPTMNFGVSRVVMEKLADNSNGIVYVFDKKDFRQRRPVEWISTTSAKPVLKIRVSRRDLPKDIEVFED